MLKIIQIKLIIFLLFTNIALSQTPTGESIWELGEGYGYNILGGDIYNYRDTDSTWAAINDNFITDENGFFVNSTNTLKTVVDSAGLCSLTYTDNAIDYIITHKMGSVKFFRLNDSTFINIAASANWSNVVMDSNVVYWTNVFSGVDYAIIIENANVYSRIYFKPTFLSSLVSLMSLRSDTLDLYLANLMDYTLSSNIDNYNVSLGNIKSRLLKQFNGKKFSLYSGDIPIFGSDTLDISVWQRHTINGGNLDVAEYVNALEIKSLYLDYPDSTIEHNANVNITNDDVEMTHIYKYAPTTNYSTDVTNDLSNSERPEDQTVILIKPDLSAIPAGSNIDSVHLEIQDFWSGQYLYEIWPVTTYWEELYATWNNSTSTLQWAGGSYSYANDLGSPGDTASNSRVESEPINWYSGDGDGLAEATQSQLDGSTYGTAIYLQNDAASTAAEFRSEDSPTPSQRPVYIIYYTEAGVGAYSSRRRKTMLRIVGD